MTTLLLVIIYIAFISLGLPDALLGSSWPVMQPEFKVPYSYAGIASMIIASGTILSSVFSSRVIHRFGTGKVTTFSVALTAVALLGFSQAPAFVWLLVAAIPLGLGAGAVDSGLNAYIAEHYESRHMSWLHSFWGVGALSGPLLLSVILAQGESWRSGYLTIALIQAALVITLFFALPLWARVHRRVATSPNPAPTGHQPLFFPLKVRGVKWALLVFFCYCGIEAGMGLWGGSYLFKTESFSPERAAKWVSGFYASITLGRFLTGFLTYKVTNRDLIRTGSLVILLGALLMLLPLPLPLTLAGFILVGLGCAPIFPCMLHETPDRFGVTHAQAVMGFQMAVAYIGLTFMPPAFGFIAAATSLAGLPFFLLVLILPLMLGAEALRRMFKN